MSQGFTNDITIPLPVSQGGTGVITSTGSGAVVLGTSPDITTPNIIGVTNASSASAGSVGEFVTSNIPYASATSFVDSISKNVTSISLSAGDWDVYGNVTFNQNIGASQCFAWISTLSASFPDNSLIAGTGVTTAAIVNIAVTVPVVRLSLSSTTTVYLTGYSTFTSGTSTGCGTISARRVR